MSKFKIFIILLIAIAGAYTINYHFKVHQENVKVPNGLKEKYNITETELTFKSISIDEALTFFDNKDGILFICNPDSEWCKYYANIINQVALENDIDSIYYLDIINDRKIMSKKYNKLVEILQDYLPNDDTGDKTIYMPVALFIRDGHIVGFNNETSYIISEESPKEYWNTERTKELKDLLKSYIEIMNRPTEIEVERNETDA